MDFDPSAFLAVNMSEEEDTVYTAPDLIEPHDGTTPPSTAAVFGGLEMEQEMQIPVPVFDTLNLNNLEDEMDYERSPQIEDTSQEMNEFCHIDVSNLRESSAPQNSPIQRTSSPHIKRIIPTSADESRFRKDFYCGNYERVKLFRLHCTICDMHLGCAPWLTERQMRMHKLLNVAVCRKCFEFYGDINFPVEDDSELYCCWCGEGGEVFCCSKCPKIVCKKCVTRNIGDTKVQEIEDNDNWLCFVCDPVDIWPHRALFWGLQRFSKEMRQNVALLSKEERIAKLSKDTSHCCLKLNVNVPSILLPRKSILSKIPLSLIAFAHQVEVRNQPDQRVPQNYFIGASSRTLNNSKQLTSQNFFIRTPQHMNNSNLIRHTTTQFIEAQVPNQNSGSPVIRSMLQHRVGIQTPSNVIRINPPMQNGNAFNRYSPYPANRQVSPMPVQSYNPRNQMRGFHPVINIPKPRQPLFHGEIINLDEDQSVDQPVIKPQIIREKPPEISHDLDWLEKGMRDIKETLSPITMMLDQFDFSKQSLQEDINKLTSFSDRLTYKIKIAICNLAKTNQDIIDASKSAVDTKVSNIVRDQFNGLSNKSISFKKIPSSVEINVTKPQENKPETTTSEKATETMMAEKPNSSANLTQPIEDFNPALLCEAVLQEGNKENKNSNKPETFPKKNSNKQVTNNLMKKTGRTSLSLESNLKSCKIGSPVKIPVILLDDDDDDDDKNSNSKELYFCQKYNIKPCKIFLKRIDSL